MRASAKSLCAASTSCGLASARTSVMPEAAALFHRPRRPSLACPIVARLHRPPGAEARPLPNSLHLITIGPASLHLPLLATVRLWTGHPLPYALAIYAPPAGRRQVYAPLRITSLGAQDCQGWTPLHRPTPFAPIAGTANRTPTFLLPGVSLAGRRDNQPQSVGDLGIGWSSRIRAAQPRLRRCRKVDTPLFMADISCPVVAIPRSHNRREHAHPRENLW